MTNKTKAGNAPEPTPTHVAMPIELMRRFSDIVDQAGCREPVFQDGEKTDLCGDTFPGAIPPFIVCSACQVRMEIGALLSAYMGLEKPGGLVN